MTLSLKTLLDDRLNVAPPLPDRLNATITVSRPDVKQAVDGKRLNLFLYQVIENQFIANQEDPRTGTTSAYGHPPLCLNLHYLMTPYSTDTDETEAHRLLGAAMNVLHDNAILLPTLMTTGGQPVLDTSLLNALEHPRINLLPLSLDDLSKIWTNAQESIRLSVAYMVTVVQVDSRQPRVSSLPVRQRNVVLTQGRPAITAVDPDVLGIGDALTITGSGLASATTKVLIGGAVVDLTGALPPTLKDTQILVSVPDDPSLWPGAQMVRVQVGFDSKNALTSGTFPQTAVSDPLPVLLAPKITSIAPTTAAHGGTHFLTINGKRLYRAQDDANIYVLIAGQTIPASRFSAKTETQIQLTVPNLPVGSYPLNVRFNAFTSQDNVVFQVT